MKLKLNHRLGIILIRALSSTWRYGIIGSPPEKPALVAFWHGLMLPVWKFFSKDNPIGVVSLSNDGEILAGLLEGWGYRLIRGSSSKNGGEVLKKIVKRANDNLILITPDGPQGPANKFKPGGVVAAHRSGVPLYLCGVRIYFKFVFGRSWDKFTLPLPFAKIVLTFSEPILVPPEYSNEKIDELINECGIKLNDTSDVNKGIINQN
jgi:lysophospholipid acyltransferase (LPLAT)-like uncharacterized protein